MKYHVISTVGDLRCERTLEWNGTSPVEREQAQTIIERDYPAGSPAPPTVIKNEVNLTGNVRDLARALCVGAMDRKTRFGCAT